MSFRMKCSTKRDQSDRASSLNCVGHREIIAFTRPIAARRFGNPEKLGGLRLTANLKAFAAA